MSIQRFLAVWLACLALSALLATGITAFLVEEERARLSVKIAVPLDWSLKWENDTLMYNSNGSWFPVPTREP
jgi:hypothetical protein